MTEKNKQPGPFGLMNWEEAPNGKLRLGRSKKPKGSLCEVRWCTRPKPVQLKLNAAGKWVERRWSLCNTCRSREFRANGPLRYAFSQVRNSAAKRGIIFSMTIEEFKTLIRGTGYLERKGHAPEDLHIDRIDANGPYSLANCRVITASVNCGKDNNKTTEPPVDDDDEADPGNCPF